MANDRMYLKCDKCNEALYLGKHHMDGWYDLRQLDHDYLEKHFWCWEGNLPVIVNEDEVLDLGKDTTIYKPKETTLIERLIEEIKRTWYYRKRYGR